MVAGAHVSVHPAESEHWLEKLQMTDLSRVVDDPAVWAPIHRIAGTLDKTLPELFASDYDQRLAAARQRLRPED